MENDQRFLQNENHSNGLIFTRFEKNSNGISRPTVFEMRMRKIHLAVDHCLLGAKTENQTTLLQISLEI